MRASCALGVDKLTLYVVHLKTLHGLGTGISLLLLMSSQQ
jgi:hypothetical protein